MLVYDQMLCDKAHKNAFQNVFIIIFVAVVVVVVVVFIICLKMGNLDHVRTLYMQSAQS